MARESYKTLMQHSLRLKQALTQITDPSTLEKSHFKNLLEPISDAAHDFAKERKAAMKKQHMDGKLREMAFRIDLEGAAIYNRVEEMSKSSERHGELGESDILLAQTAHRIIEAADDGNQDEKNLIRRLDMVTATSVHLINTGQDEEADAVLLQAADLENALIAPFGESDVGLSDLAVMCVIDYYLGRVDVAIKQQVPQVGSLFVDKAIELIMNHSVSTAKCREVATKCWEVGDDLRLQSKGEEAEIVAEAAGWLHRCLDLVQWLQKQLKPIKWMQDLNTAVHRSLVRCHLVLGIADRDALEKAKALFFDLNKLVDSRDPKVCCEAAIFNLRILRLSDAPAAEINTSIESLLSQVVWSEEVVAELLSAFAYRDPGDDISGEALMYLFEAAQGSESGSAFSQQVLQALFTFLRSYAKAKSSQAIILATSAANVVAQCADPRNLEGVLPVIETIVWGLGDHFSGNTQDEIAVQWYEFALQPIFQRDDLPANQHIIRRKAALCYVQCQDLAKAQEVLRPCPQDQAATQYLNFLVALYQNKETAALQAIDNIRRCPDLQPLQLQLMLSLADEVQNKSVLIKALSAMSEAVKDPELAKEVKIEGFTLLRNLVRLILGDLEVDSEGHVSAKVERLVQSLGSAHELFLKSPEPERNANDVIWLYKSALNAAMHGGKIWATELTTAVFDKAVQLMDDYASLDKSKGDTEFCNQLASGYFAVLSGKIFELRAMELEDDKALLLDHLQGYLPKCRMAVERALELGSAGLATLPRMEKMIDVYHVELCCEDQDWDNLDSFVKEVTAWPRSEDRTETFEMILDIASRYPSCPTNLTWETHQELHKSTSLETPQDVARYARSTRALLSSQAQDKTAEQRMIDIMDHAISVLRGPAGQQGQYPEDEGIWLLSTAFNRGLDCYDEDDFEGAQLWNGIAKDICMVVKGGGDFKSRIIQQDECVAKHFR